MRAEYEHHAKKAKLCKEKLADAGMDQSFITPEHQILPARSPHPASPESTQKTSVPPQAAPGPAKQRAPEAAPGPAQQSAPVAAPGPVTTKDGPHLDGSAKGKRGGFIKKLATEDFGKQVTYIIWTSAIASLVFEKLMLYFGCVYTIRSYPHFVLAWAAGS